MKFAILIFIFLFSLTANAQNLTRNFAAGERPRLRVENRFGQTSIEVDDVQTDKIFLEVRSPNGTIEEKEIKIESAGKAGLDIVVAETKKRIDLILRVPARTRLKITGADGEITVAGNLESVEVSTDTGTIYANVPTDALKLDFLWTESRPRFLSDLELPEVKEKAGGKFSVSVDFAKEKGRRGEREKDAETQKRENETAETGDDKSVDENSKNKNRKNDNRISLNFTTKRGVILLNVPPSEVPSDLRDRALTAAAKAVILSGDSILSEAIRKVSPRKFADFTRGLPPRRAAPNFSIRKNPNGDNAETEVLRRVNISVADPNGRAISNLKLSDFMIFENGQQREIVDVQPSTAPFNLVLLLDVSGSVEERIDFIRKAARNFINSTEPRDKLAVITFRDDVQVLSNFTTDKKYLSASLDKFDAGGGTALYDGLAYVLADTLRPLKGERTAIVILSDGDDTRSFIPFEPLLGAIEESGALVYPLYVPSGLIPQNGQPTANQTSDPLRSRYLSLTTKAEAEAKRLADISGGIYFPIRSLDGLQKAYDDVVAQLRTAYSVTYRSKTAAAPRLRVTVKQAGAFVRAGSSTIVEAKSALDSGFTDSPSAFQKINFYRQNSADITGEVKAISYKHFVTETLREFPLENLDINKSPPAFVVNDGKSKFAVSRWVSPKRTRSYPYERVYNTLALPKRATVIPIVKDEGADGDRDFLQWDTLSLMNLLEVYVVLGYYDAATKSPRKENGLIQQKFNNEFVQTKLKEISSTKLSAYEWNLRELKNLKQTVALARAAYQKIAETHKINLHDASGLANFENKIGGDILKFLEFSRQKSQKAQTREMLTDQPKETTPTKTKSRITISDYLGGKYFFTVDEAILENDTLYLIESKHNQGGKLTNTSDIKDALIKMIIYRNLFDVQRGGKLVKFKPVVRLTASQMQGAVSSGDADEKLKEFCRINNYDTRQTDFLQKLFIEARSNNFLVKLERADTTK